MKSKVVETKSNQDESVVDSHDDSKMALKDHSRKNSELVDPFDKPEEPDLNSVEALYPKREYTNKKYNAKVLSLFEGEMRYNPRMFLWRNSTDLDLISDSMKVVDGGLFILLLSYMFQIVIYKEYEYANIDELDETLIMFGLMINVVVSSLIRIFKYKLAFDFAKARMIYSKETSFMATPLFINSILETLVNIVHPSVYLNDIGFKVHISELDLYATYKLNDLICVFSVLAKFYYIMKQIFLSLEFNSNKMQRLVGLYGGDDFGFIFGFKIYMIRFPKKFIMYSLIYSMIIFAFVIRVVERPAMEVLSQANLKNWDDIVWFCFITESTIGYGDRYPVTWPGRIITFAMIVWGSIWTSLFVSTLFSIFNLSDTELRAVNLFHRVTKRQELEAAASRVVSNLLKLNHKFRENFRKVGGQLLSEDKKTQKLQSLAWANLRKTKKAKRELDFYKLETLYFEDDMISRLDKIKITEKEAIKKAIKIEEVYKNLFLDSGILDTKPLRPPPLNFKIVEKIVTEHVVKYINVDIYGFPIIGERIAEKKFEHRFYTQSDLKWALNNGILEEVKDWKAQLDALKATQQNQPQWQMPPMYPPNYVLPPPLEPAAPLPSAPPEERPSPSLEFVRLNPIVLCYGQGGKNTSENSPQILYIPAQQKILRGESDIWKEMSPLAQKQARPASDSESPSPRRGIGLKQFNDSSPPAAKPWEKISFSEGLSGGGGKMNKSSNLNLTQQTPSLAAVLPVPVGTSSKPNPKPKPALESPKDTSLRTHPEPQKKPPANKPNLSKPFGPLLSSGGSSPGPCLNGQFGGGDSSQGEGVGQNVFNTSQAQRERYRRKQRQFQLDMPLNTAQANPLGDVGDLMNDTQDFDTQYLEKKKAEILK